ncbi:MAG: DUF2953 domain-containing protein [Clostridia bacterium]|nr:DUF2953 domain-containing protein [Clostridia bacterium]
MWWKILLIIFALIFLFFWQSVHIIIAYDGEFKLIAGLGLIRLNILKLLDKFKNMQKKEKKPKEEKPEEEEPEEKKEEEEETPKETKPNVFQEVLELRGFDGAVDLLSEFSSLLAKFGGGLMKHFIIRKLVVHYGVTGKDAADTAIKFGAISTALFPSIGVINKAAQVKKHDIVIIPDYTGSEDTQEIYIHMSYRLLALIAVALGALKDFLQILKREKKINARIKARSKIRREKAVAANKSQQTGDVTA